MFNANSIDIEMEITAPIKPNVPVGNNNNNFTCTEILGTTQPYGQKYNILARLTRNMTEPQSKLLVPGRKVRIIGSMEAIENNTLIVSGRDFAIHGLSKEARENQNNNRANYNNGNQNFQQGPAQNFNQPQQQSQGTNNVQKVWG